MGRLNVESLYQLYKKLMSDTFFNKINNSKGLNNQLNHRNQTSKQRKRYLDNSLNNSFVIVKCSCTLIAITDAF